MSEWDELDPESMQRLTEAAREDLYARAALFVISRGVPPTHALTEVLLAATKQLKEALAELVQEVSSRPPPPLLISTFPRSVALLLFGAARAGAEPTFPPPEGETAWVSTAWVHGAVVASTTDKGARIYSGMVISGAPEEYFPIEAAKAQRVYEEYRERSVALGHDPGPGEYLWLFGRNKRRP